MKERALLSYDFQYINLAKMCFSIHFESFLWDTLLSIGQPSWWQIIWLFSLFRQEPPNVSWGNVYAYWSSNQRLSQTIPTLALCCLCIVHSLKRHINSGGLLYHQKGIRFFKFLWLFKYWYTSLSKHANVLFLISQKKNHGFLNFIILSSLTCHFLPLQLML